MTEEKAIELLKEMHSRCHMPTANDPKRFDKASAIEMAIHALKVRIVARELADNMVKTIRSGKDEYSDINRQND